MIVLHVRAARRPTVFGRQELKLPFDQCVELGVRPNV